MAANRDELSTKRLQRLGKNVRLLRVEHDVKQDALARDSGTTRAQLSGIEQGKTNASVLTIIKVATALGVPPGDLLRGIE